MSELDDFFAKKDRKKSKGKKFAGAEDKEKGKSDESTKNKDKLLKKERIPREDNDETAQPEQEADEWREFEEEKKDYTGLKLGHLSISSVAGAGGNEGGGADGGDDDSQGGGDEGGDAEGGGGGGPDGEGVTRHQQRHTGPWKRVADPTQQQQQQQQRAEKIAVEQKANGQVEKQQQLEADAAPKRAAGAYVPPGLRNQPARGTTPGGGPRDLQPMRMRGMKTAAPDIHNEDYFPTLAAGAPGGAASASKDKQGAFEVVSHGRGGSGNSAAHPRPSAAGQQQPLTLGNRFNTLSHNDS